jgi:hypothetical protein
MPSNEIDQGYSGKFSYYVITIIIFYFEVPYMHSLLCCITF